MRRGLRGDPGVERRTARPTAAQVAQRGAAGPQAAGDGAAPSAHPRHQAAGCRRALPGLRRHRRRAHRHQGARPSPRHRGAAA
ncbi:MAG: hypothetical protein MZV65_47925 [Chromatiales bacterium]|nr:hypothetical protein [Chromatiales bacterium]